MNSKKHILCAAGLLSCMLLLLISCDTKRDNQNGNPPTHGTLEYTDAEPSWSSLTNSATGITIRYRVRATSSGEVIQVEMSGETGGFVAVGFNPSSRMQDADIVIGFVTEGDAWVRDDFGTSGTSHGADTDEGGTADLYNVAGTEAGGTTTIGFAKLLSSGDSKDQDLVRGQDYPAIFSRGSNDSFSTIHGVRGSDTISIP